LSDNGVHQRRQAVHADTAAFTAAQPRSANGAGLDGEITMIKKTLMLMLTAVFLLAITGCNTIHGMGQDMEAAGEGIQDAASN
jgi:entericidin B